MVVTESEDADGDTMDYDFDWDVDGSNFNGSSTTFYSGDTVLSNRHNEAEDWTCTATPHDGDDDGPTASDMITIGYADLDEDGYSENEDCDDNDENIHPYAGDVFGDGEDTDCDGLDCEADWSDSMYYTVCPDSVNWSDAESLCDGAGHSLASIHSATDQSTLESLMQSAAIDIDYFMGFSDSTIEGTWGWSDGSTVDYTNWATNEPDDLGGQDCAALFNLGSAIEGMWVDFDCTDTNGYICSSEE